MEAHNIINNEEEKSCVDERSILEGIEKARKAIESYKEYKSEISFTLESHNASRISSIHPDQHKKEPFKICSEDDENCSLKSFLNQ